MDGPARGVEGQLGQLVRAKESRRIGIVAREKVPPSYAGQVDDHYVGAARMGPPGSQVEQPIEHNLKPGFFEAFPNGGRGRVFAGIDEPCRQRP
jgi:hypothetical protein